MRRMKASPRPPMITQATSAAATYAKLVFVNGMSHPRPTPSGETDVKIGGVGKPLVKSDRFVVCWLVFREGRAGSDKGSGISAIGHFPSVIRSKARLSAD